MLINNVVVLFCFEGVLDVVCVLVVFCVCFRDVFVYFDFFGLFVCDLVVCFFFMCFLLCVCLWIVFSIF